MKKLFLLAFLPVFGLLFSKNCSALQHDYNAIFTSNIYHPEILYDSNTGAYYNDNSQYDPYATVSPSSPTDNGLIWNFPSDYDFLNTKPFDSVGYHLNDAVTIANKLSYINSACTVLVSPNTHKYNVNRNLRLISNSKSVIYNTRAFTYNSWSGVNPCYKFNNGLTYNYQSGLNDIIWDIRDWSSTYTLPYSPNNFSGTLSDNGVDGLRLSDTAISHSGVTFSGSFSPSRLIQNNNMLGFKGFYVPLFTSDGYFMNYQNLYRGRQLEWRFYFNFNGDVVPRNDSTIKLTGRAYRRYRPDQHTVSDNISVGCSSELTRIGDEDYGTNVHLSVSCPLTFSNDYISFYPNLSLEAGGDYSFFEEYTSNDWYFSGAFLISDNNTEPGSPFNDDLTGGDWNLYNGSDYEASLDPDWVTSLQNLFSFNLPVGSTPLGLILGGFSNQTNCASIPTLAGLIHSNETQVCPFFSSSVRSITTPVLALFSICLVFGAFMSWLGGSSGNFIEDSSTHTWGGFKIAKGGKK